MSNLKKCMSDESLVIPLEELRVDDKLYFVEEPVEVMDREIKQLKRSRIPVIKVRWNSKRIISISSDSLEDSMGTPGDTARTEPRRKLGSKHSRSPSPIASVFRRLRRNRHPSPGPRPRKEGGVFNRLGGKNKAHPHVLTAAIVPTRREPKCNQGSIITGAHRPEKTADIQRVKTAREVIGNPNQRGTGQTPTKMISQELLLNRLYLRIVVIMEYLVKISKKARILELKQRHLEITVLTSYTSYPSRKIWHIYACTHKKPRRYKVQYAVSRRTLYVVFHIK
ncbi:hypothetical protein Tco_1003972 [Tanacetum coccineum]|uniref:Reverse transcriptase domain-containing protein n=1 Tax=Tanacetum coccineum TaxID=301880 RepID=A0ABQ5FBP4_9ASTR